VIRIEHAFCVQLNRLVTIDEARAAFGAQHDFERFEFYCAEPACALHRVRIAGVNYRIDAATGRKLVENHFRRWDEHRRECPYADVELRQDAPVIGSAGSHRTRALASDAIAIFDPPLDGVRGPDVSPPDADGSGPPPPRLKRPLHPREAPAGLTRPQRTSSLVRIVDTYRRARDVLSARELASYRLAVTGEGLMPIVQYVRPLAAAHEGPPCRVYFGGARLVRYYGLGFKLRFYDRYRDNPVYLYVASAAIQTSEERAAVSERLHAMEGGEYSTVFALGRLDASLDAKSYSIAITDLRRLVLHPPLSKRSGVQAFGASSQS
jgi:hypothetical protein